MKLEIVITVFSISMVLCTNVSAQYIDYRNTDPRYIVNGSKLPSENYADQPYVIVCDDGSWVCTMTTSSGTEGAHMNHIVSTKSYDQGQTWTNLVDVEPGGIPQSSWAVPLKVPGGRIYVFYNYNKNRVKGIVDVMSGPFMFKYSDDNGKTWSEERYEVPIRKTQIDRDNYSKGECQFFWSIDKPTVTNEAAYIAFSKLSYSAPEGIDNYERSEGFILKSENILTTRDPGKIKWELLPEGEIGIYNNGLDIVQAEHNMVMLNNGSMYVVNRTYIGSPAYSISNDGGKTFTKPQLMTYANGAPMGNTRACPKIYKTKDGNYLLWYHNNFNKHTFDGRNPAWLSGGIEKNGDILWSQPEIILYDADPKLRGMSYPDFIEQDGQMWLIETQKTAARVHEVDKGLLQGLWKQADNLEIVRDGLIMDADDTMMRKDHLAFPSLPNLFTGGGFSVELWFTVDTLEAGQVILSTFGPKHKGIKVSIAENKAIKIGIHDGEAREGDVAGGQAFISDSNTISEGVRHHVVFIVDGASKIVSIVVDGVLSDGSADTRPYGWGRIHPYMKDINDTRKCVLNSSFRGEVNRMRVYNRYLRTSEAIANYRAGLKL